MKLGKRINKQILFPELRGSLAAMKYPAFVEPKYDGELDVFTTADLGKFKGLINKYGKTREDFPAINNLPANVTLIGELYYGDGKAGRLYDLLKNKEEDSLNFKVFDITRYGIDEEHLLPLITRREHLFEYIPHESIIEAKLATNDGEALRYYQEYVNQGYEGVVIKSLESKYTTGPCSWVKLKRKDHNDLLIKTIDPNLERITVQTSTMINGNMRYVEVGVKCSNKDKVHLRVGDHVIIEHQGVLSSGSLRHPVFIGRSK